MRTAMLLTILLGLAGCDASFGTQPPLDRVVYNLNLDAENRPLEVQRYALMMPQPLTSTVAIRRRQ